MQINKNWIELLLYTNMNVCIFIFLSQQNDWRARTHLIFIIVQAALIWFGSYMFVCMCLFDSIFARTYFITSPLAAV
jgi:hypothetical protein